MGPEEGDGVIVLAVQAAQDREVRRPGRDPGGADLEFSAQDERLERGQSAADGVAVLIGVAVGEGLGIESADEDAPAPDAVEIGAGEVHAGEADPGEGEVGLGTAGEIPGEDVADGGGGAFVEEDCGHGVPRSQRSKSDRRSRTSESRP